MKIDQSFRNKIKEAIRLDRAVRFVWKAGPGWTISSLALLFFQGLLPLLALYLMKLIVDGVTASLTAPDKTVAFKYVGFLIACAAGVALLSALIQLLSNLVKEAQSLTVTDHMYDVLHAKSIEVDLEYYENPKYFDTLHRAQQEGPFRPTRIVNGLAQLVQNGISLLAMVGLLFSFHWIFAVVLFLAVIPGILVRIRYSGKMYRWQRETTQTERKTHYLNWILTGDAHAKEVRLFGLGKLFTGQFRSLRKQLRGEKIELTRKRSVADFMAQAIATIAVFGSFAFIAYRTVTGNITLGDMVMYFQAFQRGMGYLRDMLGGVAGLYEDNLFLSNLYEFLDIQPKVREPVKPVPVPRPMKTGILFEQVSFKYPGGRRYVLENISLSIAPGEVVALVGENGSGKTTLIKLLCRLYDPTEGKIKMDGLDIRNYGSAALRREISVVFQDFVRYHMTARENIRLGNIELSAENQKIDEAAGNTGADELIRRLPKGYDTVLGRWFEEGEELSTGEWQKVALARTFLRNAQIIALDEPSSSLDAKTEYEIFRGFKQLLKGRSAILISHRFSTVRMADRILVLENGHIVENGTHRKLMRMDGKYADMFEKQAQYYR